MTIEIPYYLESGFIDSLTLESPENCTLEAVDNQNRIYYLFVHSKLGITYILKYGPIYSLGDEILPFDEVPSIKSIYTGCKLEKMATNSKAIAKEIRKFVQNPSVVQARVVDESEIENILKCACEPITDIFRRVVENDTRTNN